MLPFHRLTPILVLTYLGTLVTLYGVVLAISLFGVSFISNVLYKQTAAGEPLMQLVAVDWFKDVKRIDHVARRKGCVAQVQLLILISCKLLLIL